MAADIPKQIGKYQIRRVLGKGSMGVVYEGYDPDIERQVAIKTLILNPNVEPDLVEEFHGRFKVEAKAAARCMHPNIVTILEYGQFNNLPFMVMEFINGQTLEDILRHPAPLRFNRAFRIFSQLLKGLHLAHQNTVVHRDIKPSNIMVMQDDTVKITDFGIARMPVQSGLTQVGYTVGTPHYMAPEQEAHSTVDARADLFSLAIILQEMLARIPLTSSIPQDVLSPKGIYITPKVNMTQSFPTVMLPVLQKGLAFNPDNRFQNAQEFSVALKQAMTGLQTELAGTQATAAAKSVTHIATSPVRNDNLAAKPAASEPTQKIGSNKTAAKRSAEFEKKLAEMEAMLVAYIGPNAKTLIDVYRDEVGSVSELANRVAQEIFSDEGRETFLQAWQSDSQITSMPKISTSRIQTKLHEVGVEEEKGDYQPNLALSQDLLNDQKRLKQIEELLGQYVGNKAQFLLYEGILKSKTIHDLSEKLQQSIPGIIQKTDFKLRFRKLVG